MASVGFKGLGSRGQGMVRRLLDAGNDVVVWNRSPEPRNALQDLVIAPKDWSAFSEVTLGQMKSEE
jgi:3-hydroxyisobutyrate dehydrogenase-like beta-hydroxyacid dehydrogenase